MDVVQNFSVVRAFGAFGREARRLDDALGAETSARRASLRYLEKLRLVSGVEQIDIRENSYRFTLKDKKNQLRDLLDLLIHDQVEITDMAISEPDLEDIFLTLTGKRLRD